jgi:citronellol/citronellal dehydrogenase
MHQVNARATWMVSRACLPHLLKAEAPHILTLAPPPTLAPDWWGWAGAYTLAKMGMSFVTLALAAEFAGRVAVNALWPQTLIATAAVRMIPGVDPGTGRTPAIVADAAQAILAGGMDGPDGTPPSGRFFIDEEVLHAQGVDDLTGYAVDPAKPLTLDFWVPGATPPTG